MIIQNAMFGGQKACNADDVMAAFGIEFSLTGEVILQAHALGLLNTEWVANQILTEEAKQIYRTAITQADIAYGDARLKAERVYESALVTALHDYKNASAESREIYETARFHAWQAHNTTINQLWLGYQAAKAAVLALVADRCCPPTISRANKH